jgi:hypothetical protein
MKKIHYNIPQLEYSLLRPQVGVAIMGRGTGKTEGPGAEFLARNAMDMPGSLGGIVSITYDKLLNMIIPALKVGWERMGFKENVHYWIRKAPPESLQIPKSYRQPDTNSHLIKWFNGSAMLLISIDRMSIANGASLAYIYADEVKFFQREKFKEVLLAMRGQAHLYGDLSCCESLLLTTDQPSPEMPGHWVYEMEADSDVERAGIILSIQYEIAELAKELDEIRNKKRADQLQRQIDRYLDDINEARKGFNYTLRASTLDNVHALGIRVIENLKKTLSPYEYALSVLNIKPDKSESAFYHLLSDEKHGYYAPNVEFIDGLDIDRKGNRQKTCMWDGDLVLNQPLEIGCDYNSQINWVVIGQEKQDSYDILNSMWVQKPRKIKHLVEKFDRYYAEKKKYNKLVIFNYDHTAIGEDAKDDISFAVEWSNELRKLGWEVAENYLGKTSTHRSRFVLWQNILHGGPGLKPIRFNLANNIDLLIGMRATRTTKDKEGSFKKDKSSELKSTVAPEHATHGGEAADTLVWAKYRERFNGEPSFLHLASG